MKTLVIAMLLAAISVGFAEVPKAVRIEDAQDFRTSVAAAKQLMVHEGLPHQSDERELLQQELKRGDVTKIAKFPFYTPARPAMTARLQELLADPKNLGEWRGGGLCCVFHPDYCVSWSVDGKTFSALICLGCHEVILVEGNQQLHYKLEDRAYESIKKELVGHASKRPPPQKKKPGKF